MTDTSAPTLYAFGHSRADSPVVIWDQEGYPDPISALRAAMDMVSRTEEEDMQDAVHVDRVFLASGPADDDKAWEDIPCASTPDGAWLHIPNI